MQITKKSGRKRDEACNKVDVDADGYVYCLRCEGVDHKLEFTHVDRVKRHLRETCAKRPRQEVVTTYLPPQIDTATQNLFDKMFALWLFSTGMAFYKVQHENFVAVSCLLPPSVKIPSQHLIRARLLDECHEDSPVRMRGALARRFYSLYFSMIKNKEDKNEKHDTEVAQLLREAKTKAERSEENANTQVRNLQTKLDDMAKRALEAEDALKD
ncbi:hypothetical protein PF010_g3268 [Phytophthora fragariae]|uniref:BED-type domain-containing protein n=1 Tax=Phytophthora fragariae TaxID=53985 RepID=A0A6G0LUQ1_9STRA|nr:hypothetical protein PF010_g3268 [Phytophthora fragariae]